MNVIVIMMIFMVIMMINYHDYHMIMMREQVMIKMTLMSSIKIVLMMTTIVMMVKIVMIVNLLKVMTIDRTSCMRSGPKVQLKLSWKFTQTSSCMPAVFTRLTLHASFRDDDYLDHDDNDDDDNDGHGSLHRLLDLRRRCLPGSHDTFLASTCTTLFTIIVGTSLSPGRSTV